MCHNRHATPVLVAAKRTAFERLLGRLSAQGAASSARTLITLVRRL